MTESQAQENLDVELPDGRSFRKLFWPSSTKKVLVDPSIKATGAENIKSLKDGVVEASSKVGEELTWTKVQKKK